MVPYDFLKLFPQLVCQASQSKATLNQLLGTHEAKALTKQNKTKTVAALLTS
jgi:hypothetical protein